MLHVGAITKSFYMMGWGPIRVCHRLTSLALLYIHRGLSASPEIVEGTLNLFTAQHKRRMALKFESLVA